MGYTYVAMLKLLRGAKRFDRLEPVLLGGLGLKERELQECICNSPKLFFDELEDENLLILGTEVTPSDVVGDRIDILALDPTDGTSVIIELKRGTSKWQLSQALAYAAMISNCGAGQEFLEFLSRSTTVKREEISFAKVEIAELNRSQRVIMVAEAYDYEVLVAAQWLNEVYEVDIACYQITLARDGNADALYVSCTRIYPPQELSELARLRRSAKSTAGPARKDLEAMLSRSGAEVTQFFRDRLKQKARTDSRDSALAYPQTGTIRWYVQPRRTGAHVYQVGRFQHGPQDDESFWKQNLSNANVGYRKNATCLRFHLSGSSDFEFFQKTMDTEAATFSWKTGRIGDEAPAEEPEPSANG